MQITIYFNNGKNEMSFLSNDCSIFEDYEHYKNLSKEEQESWKTKVYHCSDKKERITCDFSEVVIIQEEEERLGFFVG